MESFTEDFFETEVLPEAEYDNAKLTSVRKEKEIETSNGVRDRIALYFDVDGYLIVEKMNIVKSQNSKLYRFIKGMSGGDFSEGFSFEDYIGDFFTVEIEHNETEERVWANIEAIEPTHSI